MIKYKTQEEEDVEKEEYIKIKVKKIINRIYFASLFIYIWLVIYADNFGIYLNITFGTLFFRDIYLMYIFLVLLGVVYYAVEKRR